ncbi:hypothetical protein [Bacteroides faecis]|uniref:hypothetical protein n=1 Tax=Bacteroides faecis TaxID=674529 RepID=UPI00286E94F9|nr:hypothetical protein [Bacteroides faecis]MCS2479031.1 hypothetical protein [Bacteroides faecis]
MKKITKKNFRGLKQLFLILGEEKCSITLVIILVAIGVVIGIIPTLLKLLK